MGSPQSTFYIKQNDTAPSIIEYLRYNDRTPITGISSVRFHLRAPDGTTKIDAAATIVDAAQGKVQYDWTGTDTNTVGTFFREWQCTLNTGKIITVPNDQNYQVIITDDIA